MLPPASSDHGRLTSASYRYPVNGTFYTNDVISYGKDFFDNEYTQDIPGSPDEFYGSFDKANARRAPRQLRFGARISF